MAFEATLSFSDSGGGKDSFFKVLSCSFGFTQNTDHLTGQPNARVMINNINLSIESTKDTQLADWMVNNKSTKNGKILFNIQGDEQKTLEFENAFCVMYNESFINVGESPMTIDISFTARKIKLDGGVVECELFDK
ncbi:MAG: hypothetical protein DRJ05_02320 [Bacteroidetes bacterium]|nr:MAG: hypothetical protein DRJ05_02320 [Bacteroidota bacterium]